MVGVRGSPGMCLGLTLVLGCRGSVERLSVRVRGLGFWSVRCSGKSRISCFRPAAVASQGTLGWCRRLQS